MGYVSNIHVRRCFKGLSDSQQIWEEIECYPKRGSKSGEYFEVHAVETEGNFVCAFKNGSFRTSDQDRKTVKSKITYNGSPDTKLLVPIMSHFRRGIYLSTDP
jgi:hypothetical protein